MLQCAASIPWFKLYKVYTCGVVVGVVSIDAVAPDLFETFAKLPIRTPAEAGIQLRCVRHDGFIG